MVETMIGNDLAQPGRECILRIVTGQRTKRFDERLLDQIVGLRGILDDTQGQLIGKSLMLIQQFGKGPLIPVEGSLDDVSNLLSRTWLFHFVYAEVN